MRSRVIRLLARHLCATLGTFDLIAWPSSLMRHFVATAGTDTLAAWSGGFGPAHAARALSPTTAATLSSSTTHDCLLPYAVQLAFDFFQLLAQHIGFFP